MNILNVYSAYFLMMKSVIARVCCARAYVVRDCGLSAASGLARAVWDSDDRPPSFVGLFSRRCFCSGQLVFLFSNLSQAASPLGCVCVGTSGCLNIPMSHSPLTLGLLQAHRSEQ